ncbi:MAG: DUF2905 domain-containing protein [Chlamydiia bacterium]|nr:DUF2905 domain-containing protein [Chlamydiia bacterium]
MVIIGAVITLDIPLDWIGHLPGDFSVQWGSTKVFVPVTTSVIFSFGLSILLFLFSRR